MTREFIRHLTIHCSSITSSTFGSIGWGNIQFDDLNQSNGFFRFFLQCNSLNNNHRAVITGYSPAIAAISGASATYSVAIARPLSNAANLTEGTLPIARIENNAITASKIGFVAKYLFYDSGWVSASSLLKNAETQSIQLGSSILNYDNGVDVQFFAKWIAAANTWIAGDIQQIEVDSDGEAGLHPTVQGSVITFGVDTPSKVFVAYNNIGNVISLPWNWDSNIGRIRMKVWSDSK